MWRRSALEGDVGRGDGEPFSTSCIFLGIMRAFISVASVAEHRSGKGWNAGFWLQVRVRVKVFFGGQRRNSKRRIVSTYAIPLSDWVTRWREGNMHRYN